MTPLKVIWRLLTGQCVVSESEFERLREGYLDAIAVMEEGTA